MYNIIWNLNFLFRENYGFTSADLRDRVFDYFSFQFKAQFPRGLKLNPSNFNIFSLIFIKAKQIWGYVSLLEPRVRILNFTFVSKFHFALIFSNKHNNEAIFC